MQRPLWFAAKRYGYGWYPVTPQGWAVMAIWLLWFAGSFLRWDGFRHDGSTDQLYWAGDVALSVLALVAVSYLTGEKPRWRWGK